MVFYKEAFEKIDRKEYQELITVRSNKDNVRFMVKENGNTIHELLMISVGDDGFTLLSFVGDIDLDRLSRLSSDMGIKGMENLKNVKRK
jgi:tryptophanase